MTDIFLSYAEHDRDKARRLAEALGAAGWDVWWDRRIPAGKTWREVLDAQLKSMRCMVVLWSRRSVASDWVCEEAAEGRKLQKLVPVLIEAVQPPVGFRELQAADLAGWDGSSRFAPLQELLLDIERLLGKPHAAGGGPIPPISAGKASTKRRWMTGALAAVLTIGVLGMVLGPQVAGVWQDRAGKQDKAQRAPAPGSPASTRSGSIDAGDLTRSVDASRGGSFGAPQQGVNLTAAAVKERCARLKERLSLGETLSEESRSFFLKDCSR